MERQKSSRTCILCGRQNEISLKMTWTNDQEAKRVISTVSVPEAFNGYPGIVHGGIVAALLDETAGRAVMLDGSDDNLMVTMKLEVRYRRPTPTGQPLTVAGWVVQGNDRRAQVASEIRLADGTVTAEAEALVVAAPGEFRSRWEAEKPYWRVYDD